MTEAEVSEKLTSTCKLIAKEVFAAAEDLGSIDALCAILNCLLAVHPLNGIAELDLETLWPLKPQSPSANNAKRSSSAKAGHKDLAKVKAEATPGRQALQLQLRLLQQACQQQDCDQPLLVGSVLWSTYELLANALLPGRSLMLKLDGKYLCTMYTRGTRHGMVMGMMAHLTYLTHSTAWSVCSC